MKLKRAPLLAVDVPVLLHRGQHKGPDPLQSSITELAPIIKRHKPRAVAMCFGLGAAKYRVRAHPAYHADRTPRSKTLRDHFALAPSVYKQFGWENYTSDTLEADDLLYSLSKAEAKNGGRTLILTQDKDLFAAASPKTQILFLGANTDIPIGPQQIQRRLGISPAQMTDYIALVGDPADGIPGAKGIGAKTACELLCAHGTLEGAIAADGRLRAQAPQLRTYWQVAKLRTTRVELPPTRQTDWEHGAAHLDGLGYQKLAERLMRVYA